MDYIYVIKFSKKTNIKKLHIGHLQSFKIQNISLSSTQGGLHMFSSFGSYFTTRPGGRTGGLMSG
jgi:hypothetical protein